MLRIVSGYGALKGSREGPGVGLCLQPVPVYKTQATWYFVGIGERSESPDSEEGCRIWNRLEGR